MPRSLVVGFSENTETMTYAQGLAFVERTRRQLDRFDSALLRNEGETIDPVEAGAIRHMCDALEKDILSSLESR